MDYSTIELPILDEELRWQSRRNLAVGLATLAVALATVAVSVAALLIH
jgi:hypothetical protein